MYALPMDYSVSLLDAEQQRDISHQRTCASRRRIAQNLFLSPSSVVTHRQSVLTQSRGHTQEREMRRAGAHHMCLVVPLSHCIVLPWKCPCTHSSTVHSRPRSRPHTHEMQLSKSLSFIAKGSFGLTGMSVNNRLDEMQFLCHNKLFHFSIL